MSEVQSTEGVPPVAPDVTPEPVVTDDPAASLATSDATEQSLKADTTPASTEPSVDHYDRVLELVGDISDDDTDPADTLAKFTERDIERMSPQARQMLRRMAQRERKRSSANDAAKAQLTARVEARETAIAERERALLKGQRQYADALRSPEILKKIAEADKVKAKYNGDMSTVDMSDPEQARDFVKYTTGETWKEFVAPVHDQAQALKRRETRMDLEDSHKWFAEKEGQDAVRARVRAAMDASKAAALADGKDEAKATEIAKASVRNRLADFVNAEENARLRAAEANRRKARQARAARSAAHIATNTADRPTPKTPDGPPAGLTGSAKLDWFRKHPKAAKTYRARMRGHAS